MKREVGKKCGVALLAAALLILGAASGEAAGQKGKEPQKFSDAHLAQAIHTLQSIKLTLEKADHDYGGHRAAAVRDIAAAERQLKLALAHVHKVNKTDIKTNDKAGRHEPQRLSDAQLREAIPALRHVVGMLEKADHDYGGHKANAIRDLRAAVHQLEKALQFSRVKNQSKP